MATAAIPRKIGERARADAANTYGVPANVNGVVVGVYNSVTSTGIQWIIVLRVPDDVYGSFDYHLLASDVTNAT